MKETAVMGYCLTVGLETRLLILQIPQHMAPFTFRRPMAAEAEIKHRMLISTASMPEQQERRSATMSAPQGLLIQLQTYTEAAAQTLCITAARAFLRETCAEGMGVRARRELGQTQGSALSSG